MKTLFILIVGIIAGYNLNTIYRHSRYGQVNACVNLYMGSVDTNDPDIQEAIKKEGFKNVKELIEDRCEYWVRTGQIFPQGE